MLFIEASMPYARCQKIGVRCTDSPTKRPGRPRRVAAGGTAATATSNREPSLSYTSSKQPTGSSSPIESTRLSLGAKLIQGSSKVNALSRLVGLKLRQMRELLEEFQTRKSMEPSSENIESVQLLISGALKRINVATGMPSTL